MLCQSLKITSTVSMKLRTVQQNPTITTHATCDASRVRSLISSRQAAALFYNFNSNCFSEVLEFRLLQQSELVVICERHNP